MGWIFSHEFAENVCSPCLLKQTDWIQDPWHWENLLLYALHNVLQSGSQSNNCISYAKLIRKLTLRPTLIRMVYALQNNDNEVHPPQLNNLYLSTPSQQLAKRMFSHLEKSFDKRKLSCEEKIPFCDILNVLELWKNIILVVVLYFCCYTSNIADDLNVGFYFLLVFFNVRK